MSMQKGITSLISSRRDGKLILQVIESRAAGASDVPIGARTPGGRAKTGGDRTTRISTLSIIDLAGSERHTSSKERNAEGKHINQS
jgi:centromeric protein E